ncbi:MAG: bifunctional 2-polyprenyl-6-hydroxyphenol methylase/3-demethylubiquinol 3-O-methyltransferase UbiG [Burkholderiales bacterium]
MNVDPQELAKFSDLAHRWWDPESEFKPLHQINPLRLDWIASIATLEDARVIDVGCGGGILAESIARRGARVKGIDLAQKPLRVAQLHQLESGVGNLDYEEIAAEAIALREPHSFDVVTCMEVLEHVPDPAQTVAACARLVRPNGHIFLSTINRNPKAYLFAILGAEYLLRLLPRRTHDYAKFIKPSELALACRKAGLEVKAIIGMSYNPISKVYALGRDTDVNYLMHAVRP